jgi:hypothetical protein
MYYYMVQSRGAKLGSNTVVAPTGYCRLRDGSIKRDGTPSPEMGPVSPDRVATDGDFLESIRRVLSMKSTKPPESKP